MSEDRDEIQLYNKKSSNGLSLGLIYSDESAPLNRYSAKLITDGRKFTLTDETPSFDVDLISETINVTLINLTSSLAGISVAGTSKNIELKDVIEINNKEVFLTSMSGSYPGTATVEGIIGIETIDLDNKIPAKVVKIESIDYLVELFSASDNNAIIIVKKCDNSTTTIIEIADEIIANETQINETAESNLTNNDSTITNDTTQNPINQSSNLTNNEEDSISNGLEEVGTRPVEFYFNIFFLVIIIVIFLIIGIFIIKYFKMKKDNVQI